MKRKFSPDVYTALSSAGMSNREIARHLDVNEASVRRALKNHSLRRQERQYLVTVTEVA